MSSRQAGCDVRTAEDLAEGVRQRSGVGDPPFTLGALLQYYDLDVAVRKDLAKSGALDAVDGRVTVLLRDNSPLAQRFTAAHELGHYLLAAEEKISIARQERDRSFEKYCNAFASHLLLPRPWLRAQVAHRPVALSSAHEIAELAGCSLTSVIFALRDDLEWFVDLYRWDHRFGAWRLTVAPASLGGPSLWSDGQTAAALEDLAEGPAQIPLASTDGHWILNADVLRIQGSIYALTEAGDRRRPPRFKG
jgi:hypothetical protein